MSDSSQGLDFTVTEAFQTQVFFTHSSHQCPLGLGGLHLVQSAKLPPLASSAKLHPRASSLDAQAGKEGHMCKPRDSDAVIVVATVSSG